MAKVYFWVTETVVQTGKSKKPSVVEMGFNYRLVINTDGDYTSLTREPDPKKLVMEYLRDAREHDVDTNSMGVGNVLPIPPPEYKSRPGEIDRPMRRKEFKSMWDQAGHELFGDMWDRSEEK